MEILECLRAASPPFCIASNCIEYLLSQICMRAGSPVNWFRLTASPTPAKKT
jgi:hypothetical protein